MILALLHVQSAVLPESVQNHIDGPTTGKLLSPVQRHLFYSPSPSKYAPRPVYNI